MSDQEAESGEACPLCCLLRKRVTACELTDEATRLRSGTTLPVRLVGSLLMATLDELLAALPREIERRPLHAGAPPGVQYVEGPVDESLLRQCLSAGATRRISSARPSGATT